MQKCSVCLETKNLDQFAFRKDVSLHRKQCRVCRSNQRQKRYTANKEKETEQTLKRYYANHDEEKAKRRAYYRENREAYVERNKHWCRENRALVNKWQRERRQRPYYRYREMLRSLVRRVSETDRSTLGYTLDEFKAHMESQFKEGMSWDNHGKWEIDHVKPVVVFFKEGVTDPKIVNALSNLQPLWKSENRKKSSKYVDTKN